MAGPAHGDVHGHSHGPESDEVEILDPREVERADSIGYRIPAEELSAWSPFTALEVHIARRHEVDADVARDWRRQGIEIRDAINAIALDLTPEAIRPWTERGFVPADAVDGQESGVDLETALAWRAVGFTFPDALLLIDDGWTLEAAETARYADIGSTRRG